MICREAAQPTFLAKIQLTQIHVMIQIIIIKMCVNLIKYKQKDQKAKPSNIHNMKIQ